MKTSFSAVITLLLGASMATAALEPRATMAPHPHQRRGNSFSDGLDLSAILADPSSYLAKASSAFKNSKVASEFAKATAKPSFEKSLSKELVSQFGSKTASIALQQYTAILGKLDETKTSKSSSKATGDSSESSSLDDTVATSTAASVATVATSADTSTSTSSADSQVLGISTSGASSTTAAFSMTLVASAMSLGAGLVLAAL